jgi:hypothetical protein
VFDLFNNYLMVPGEVRLLFAHDSTLLIGTDREIWLYDGSGIKLLAGYGVPKGQSLSFNQYDQVFFQTKHGVCTLPFQNLTLDKLWLPPGETCSSGVRNIDASDFFLTLTNGASATELTTFPGD